MAGHGWVHEAPPPGGIAHVVHGAVISANQAEHLSRSREEVRSIVLRCHEWFSRNGLPLPDTYVPPAWALGGLTWSDLEALPFRHYETLTGFIDAGTRRRIRVPLVGFEAASVLSAWTLGVSNRLNVTLARMLDRPVRVCLHPSDLELRLARSLCEMLERPWSWVEDAGSLFDPSSVPSGSLSRPTIPRRREGE
jgi:predicted deacetylase